MKKNPFAPRDTVERDLSGPIHDNVENTSAHIDNYFRNTEAVVRSLKKELDYYRARHDEQSSQQRDLSQMLTRIADDEKEITNLKGEVSFLTAERARLVDELEPLRSENKRLSERCAELEASSAEERMRRDEAQEVIVLLEAQVQELESIVQLLREHQEFTAIGRDKP